LTDELIRIFNFVVIGCCFICLRFHA
jgi:hypothetical protein